MCRNRGLKCKAAVKSQSASPDAGMNKRAKVLSNATAFWSLKATLAGKQLFFCRSSCSPPTSFAFHGYSPKFPLSFPVQTFAAGKESGQLLWKSIAVLIRNLFLDLAHKRHRIVKIRPNLIYKCEKRQAVSSINPMAEVLPIPQMRKGLHHVSEWGPANWKPIQLGSSFFKVAASLAFYGAIIVNFKGSC